MASLQCSKCGEGIHYHSQPQGIEYIYFSLENWKNICSTKFDRNNKVMDELGNHPKLFRSSTIESDFSKQFIKIWKCPNCETLHIFSDDKSVKLIYEKSEKESTDDCFEKGILFSDYEWDVITEKDIPNNELISVQPTFYVKKSDKRMLVSEYPDFLKIIHYEIFVPEWMKK